jgi:hypothetical protein
MNIEHQIGNQNNPQDPHEEYTVRNNFRSGIGKGT